uniref:Uncharacterized protein n=1 Tax=Tanacetum cinerariifolium TaxID=118510 RepID=A0A6L2J9L6_TANCI|nr:hypothetical protein [Tanacetum cinerariifolium]
MRCRFILNGDSLAPTRVVEGVLQPVAPTTAEQKLARKNELKACGTLLMALPDKHQLKFNSHKDAKTLMEAIEKRFRGNTETKKVQETLLKQQYENFIGTTTPNLAFVSSSNTDSTTEPVSAAASVSVVCAKMPVPQFDNEDLKQIDVDDLEEMDLKWQMAMLTIRARRFLQRTGRNLRANGPTYLGFDMSKVECYNLHMKGHFARECRSPKDSRRNGDAELQRRNVPVETSTSNALVSQYDGVGSYDWSFQADEEPANYALMAFSSLSSFSNNEVFTRAMFDYDDYLSLESDESWPPSFLYDRFQSSDGYHAVPPQYTRTFMPPKPDLVFNNVPNGVETDHFAFTVKLSPTKLDQALSYTIRSSEPIIEDWVSDYEDESETNTLQIIPSFVQSTKQVKSPRHSIQHVTTSIPAATPKPASLKPTSNGKRRNRKACFVCKSLDHLIKDFPTVILTQSKPVPITAVRPGNTAVPKIKVTRPRHAKQIVTKPKSLIKRHINQSPSPEVSNSPPRVTAVKAPVGRMTVEMDQDADIVLEDDKEVADDVKDVQDDIDESAQDQGRKAEYQAKIYKIDLEHANKVLSMQEDESEPAKVQEVVDVVTTAKLITEVVTAAGETITAASTIITAAEAQVPAVTLTASPARVTAASSRRRKGVVIRDPKESIAPSIIIPAKTKSKDKGKRILVEEPKPLKKQAQIKQDEQYARELEAELNRTIDWDEVINHVKKKAKEDPANVAGFKMDYFKGMSYDDIHPVFEKYFDSNVAFLIKSKEQMDEEASRALKRLNETLAKKAAKKQNLDEDVDELKRHLQIVPNKDDHIYTKATQLAQKVPVVDYDIIEQNNKPYYKIIRTDVGAMFEKPDIHAQIWKNQIERKYPLTKFTLDQMQNVVGLEVEEESKVSLELLWFIRQQHQEGAQLE